MEEFAFFTLDHEGYLTRWNEGARQLLGYDADAVLGRHVRVMFAEADRDSNVPDDLIETARSEGTVTHEGWRVRADDSRFWTELTIAASYDESGTICGFGTVIEEAPRAEVTQ